MLAAERDWTLPAHIDLIDGLLVRVAAGELKRLIVTVPVRHGKSELCSRFFPAWLLGMFPDRRVIVAGYGAEFAAEWGEKARETLQQYGQRFFGQRVSRSSGAKARWRLEQQEGGMFALGVGSPLTGRGANTLVIDDPHKNAEEADSELLRERIWNWYWSTARTRLEPGGAVVILMARWHEDDLVGRLKHHPDDVEPWTVVNLPALAEADDALGREPGEPLWPERFDRDELEATRTAMLSRWWNALYMQKPQPAEGVMFKRADFRYYEIETDMVGAIERRWYALHDSPDEVRRFDAGRCGTFQTVDVAASESETADWTVVATWAHTAESDLILLDVSRQHFETMYVAQFLEHCSDDWGRPPMYVETAGSGRIPMKQLSADGYPARAFKHGEGTQLRKELRAEHAMLAYERHRVFHPRDRREHPFVSEFEDELCAFPTGRNDDQVDVTSYAARLLPQLSPSRQPPTEQKPGPKPYSVGVRARQF